MKDCIKIEELKMFVGTGLKAYEGFDGVYDNEPSAITGVDEEDGELLFIDSEGCRYSEFKPLVIPLSELTEDDCEDDNIPTFILSQIQLNLLNKNNPMFGVDYGNFMYLVSKHYDIFNWIDRGLAEPIQEETKC